MTSSNQEPSEIQEVPQDVNETPSFSKNQPSKQSATTLDEPAFGWSAYAERVNGRFAMIGFIAILIIEVASNDAFLRWAGLLQ